MILFCLPFILASIGILTCAPHRALLLFQQHSLSWSRCSNGRMLSVVGYSTSAAEPYIDPPSSGRGGFLLRRWPSRLTHSRPGFSLAIGSLFSSSPVYLLSVSKGRNPFNVRYAFNTPYTYILLINVSNTLSKEEFFVFTHLFLLLILDYINMW